MGFTELDVERILLQQNCYSHLQRLWSLVLLCRSPMVIWSPCSVLPTLLVLRNVRVGASV